MVLLEKAHADDTEAANLEQPLSKECPPIHYMLHKKKSEAAYLPRGLYLPSLSLSMTCSLGGTPKAPYAHLVMATSLEFIFGATRSLQLRKRRWRQA